MAAAETARPRVIRLAIIGDEGVGKTEIFRWLKEEYHGPIGVDAVPTATETLPPPPGASFDGSYVSASNADRRTHSECVEMMVDDFIDDPEYPYNRDVIRIFRSARDSTLPSATAPATLSSLRDARGMSSGTSRNSAATAQHPHHNQSLQVRANHNGKYWPTVSPSFYTFRGIAGHTVQIWDISGQREFYVLAYCFPEFHNVDGFILAYDMTSKSSFHNLEWWHQQFVQAREQAIVDEIKVRRKRLRAYLKKNGGLDSGGSHGGDSKDGNFAVESTDTDLADSFTVKGARTSDGVAISTPKTKSRFSDLLKEKPSPPPFVVVGTKSDFEEGRQIAHASVAEFCDLHQGDDSSIIGPAHFFEVSARVPGEGAPIMRVLEHLVSKSAAAPVHDQQRIINALDAAAGGAPVANTHSSSSDAQFSARMQRPAAGQRSSLTRSLIAEAAPEGSVQSVDAFKNKDFQITTENRKLLSICCTAKERCRAFPEARMPRAKSSSLLARRISSYTVLFENRGLSYAFSRKLGHGTGPGGSRCLASQPARVACPHHLEPVAPAPQVVWIFENFPARPHFSSTRPVAIKLDGRLRRQ